MIEKRAGRRSGKEREKGCPGTKFRVRQNAQKITGIFVKLVKNLVNKNLQKSLQNQGISTIITPVVTLIA